MVSVCVKLLKNYDMEVTFCENLKHLFKFLRVEILARDKRRKFDQVKIIFEGQIIVNARVNMCSICL